jgi:hypothetical protein
MRSEIGTVIRRAVIVVAATLSTAVPGQQSGASKVAKPENSKQQTAPTGGTVEGSTYKNTYLGLHFTPAKGLTLGRPEMREAAPAWRVISVLAYSGPDWVHSKEIISFSADSLEMYKQEERTPEAYMKEAVKALETQGMKRAPGSSSAKIGPIIFARADVTWGSKHQVLLLTMHRGYALMFGFTAQDEQAADKLIAETRVELTQ